MSVDFVFAELGDVAVLEMGQSPPSALVNDAGRGIPFLQGNAEFGADHPEARLHCAKPGKRAREGDVLISVRAPVGAINRADQEYCIGRGLAAVRFTAVDGNFGIYALGFAAPQLTRNAQGTTFEAIGKGELKSLAVPVPPLPEQRRIAEVLDTADEAIRQTEALIAKLKQMKQGLLHDLLTRGLDENGELRDPVAHPEQFKDSPLGRIPTGWVVTRLRDAADVFGGKRLPAGHLYAEQATGYRYLRVIDFFNRPVEWSELEALKHATFLALQRYEIHPGELFISIAGSLGYVGVLRPNTRDRIVLTENAARIVIRDAFDAEFLALQMNGAGVQAQIEAAKGTGGGVPKLALFRIENLCLAVPSVEEQKQLVALLSAHDARIHAEQAYLHKLQLLKQGLMQDLLTGRVRVPVPDTEPEPAEVGA